MDARIYWIWLQQALEPGNAQARVLLGDLASPEGVYQAGADALEAYELDPRIIGRLGDKSLKPARAILQKTMDAGDWVLTPDDAYYPDGLRGLPDLPLVLYGRGRMPDLNRLPSIAVVGKRKISDYGRQATAWLAGGLALGGAVVVSGGACGGDAVAHAMALEAGGITIAVQCCGLDVNYPVENAVLRDRIVRRGGALLTEFPPGTVNRGYFFEIRNRLLAGLSLGTCVTEANLRSGTMITARHAREQGRDLYAVAGNVVTGSSEGTNFLINEGARLIAGAREVLGEYAGLPQYEGLIDPEAADRVWDDPRFRVMEDPYIVPPARPFESAPVKKRKKRDAPLPPVAPLPLVADVPVLKLAQPPPPAPCPEYASDNAKAVYNAMGDGPRPLDALLAAAGLSAPQALSALTELELYGCVENRPGQTYQKKRA